MAVRVATSGRQGRVTQYQSPRTDYLFAMPSFISGMASVFDLWGSFEHVNFSRSDAESDTRALRCDARMIAQDASVAFGRVSEQLRLFEVDPRDRTLTPQP